MPDSGPLEEVSDAPSPGSRAPRFDVFLSHNNLDKPLVVRIAERLKRARLEPWLDAWCLVPGEDWQRGLADGLSTSRSCAVFVGPADLGAWANQEVAVALDRAAADPGFRLFLVLLPGLPERFDAVELSPFLRMRTWVDYRRGLDDERAFHALVSAIHGLPLGPAVAIEPDTGRCPYRGLEVFKRVGLAPTPALNAWVQNLRRRPRGQIEPSSVWRRRDWEVPAPGWWPEPLVPGPARCGVSLQRWLDAGLLPQPVAGPSTSPDQR